MNRIPLRQEIALLDCLVENIEFVFLTREKQTKMSTHLLAVFFGCGCRGFSGVVVCGSSVGTCQRS